MKRTLTILATTLAMAGGACGRSSQSAADTTLASDMSMAAQHTRDSIQLDSVERARVAPVPGSATNYRTEGGEVVHHSDGTTSSSGGTVVKNTDRDAAIGAAAGALVGVTSSRNKVKGGVIGAAVGGLLGGVIGNNVDKKKKP